MSDIPPTLYHVMRVCGSDETHRTVRDVMNGNDGSSWHDAKLNIQYEQLTAAQAVDYFKNKIKEDQRVAANGFQNEPTDDLDNLPAGRLGTIARAVNDRLTDGAVESYGVNNADEVSPRRTGTAPSTSGRRGRPPKSAASAVAVASPNDDADSGDEAVPAKRGRGRPPTKKTGKSPGGASGSANGKKRGRPSKKVAKEASDGSESDDSLSEKNDDSGELQQEEEEADD